MKSIERRFKNIAKYNPNLGAYVVLAGSVREQHFSHVMIARKFNKLVPKIDFDFKDKKKLYKHLYSLNDEPKSKKTGLNHVKNVANEVRSEGSNSKEILDDLDK